MTFPRSSMRRGQGNHITTVSALGILTNTIEPDVSGGSLSAESTAQAFIELCAKGDVPYESPQPQPGDAYTMRRWWLISKLRRALTVIERTEGGEVFEDREGELGFHLAQYRATRTVSKTFVSTTPGVDEIRIVGDPRRKNAVKDVHNEVAGAVRQFEEKSNETLFAIIDPISISLGCTPRSCVSVYPVESGGVSELDTLLLPAPTGRRTRSRAEAGTTAPRRWTSASSWMDFNEVHITDHVPDGRQAIRPTRSTSGT